MSNQCYKTSRNSCESVQILLFKSTTEQMLRDHLCVGLCAELCVPEELVSNPLHSESRRVIYVRQHKLILWQTASPSVRRDQKLRQDTRKVLKLKNDKCLPTWTLYTVSFTESLVSQDCEPKLHSWVWRWMDIVHPVEAFHPSLVSLQETSEDFPFVEFGCERVFKWSVHYTSNLNGK